LGVVKPDVTAPGTTIASANVGAGNDVLVISGTSMATPDTAGIAALVKTVHPTWTTEQLKAAIMNTPGHDLFTGPDQTGDRYGPARVGKQGDQFTPGNGRPPVRRRRNQLRHRCSVHGNGEAIRHSPRGRAHQPCGCVGRSRQWCSSARL
jgi:hypothetical protein